jgi:hypothetical protein
MKARSAAALRRQIDKELSLFVRNRDGWTCVLCGDTYRPVLSAGHLFSRGADSTRFDPMNVFCQCTACNGYHEINPHLFTLWFIRQFGLKAYQQLNTRHRTLAHFKQHDLEKMLSALKTHTRPYASAGVFYKPDPLVRQLVRVEERRKREGTAFELRKHGIEARLTHLETMGAI